MDSMPVLAKFYGIVIRMLSVQSVAARFHAIYDRWELVVRIAPLGIIQGDAPVRVRNMVIEWAAQHQDELLADWERISTAQIPLPIQPLK